MIHNISKEFENGKINKCNVHTSVSVSECVFKHKDENILFHFVFELQKGMHYFTNRITMTSRTCSYKQNLINRFSMRNE